MPAAPPPPPVPQTAVVEDEDAVDWGFPANPGRQPFYVPRRKQNVGPMIAFGLLAAAVIVGGTIEIVHYLRPPPAPVPAPAPKVVVEEPRHLKNIFTTPDKPPVAAPPAPDLSAPDSADDSNAGDSDLDEVEGAALAGDPATAILKIDDYAQKHPGKNQAKLKKFENDCLDRLWWARITQLCNKAGASLQRHRPESERSA